MAADVPKTRKAEAPAPQMSQSEAQAWLRKRGFTPSPQTAQFLAAQAAWADAAGDREAAKVYRERLINIGLALAWTTTKNEPRRLGGLQPLDRSPRAAEPEPPTSQPETPVELAPESEAPKGGL